MNEHHHHHSDTEPEVDSSQVRSIIRQLNADAPGKEKGREVVVRADGTKVVRVTKKRKTMVSQEEKSRHGRKLFMQSFFLLLLLLAGVAGFFFYRMTTMSGTEHLKESGQELAKVWGATSVRCTGGVIDGVNFHISNIVAEFPESSMIERVELSEIDAELDLGSFVTGIVTGDNLTIARAHIHLRASARQLAIPQLQDVQPWRFQRVTCPDFSISFAGDEASPWSIRHTSAYMYRPSSSSPLTVVTLEGGAMQMRGWKAINIQTAKIHFSQLAIEDFTLNGTTDVANTTTESSKTSVTFSGSLADRGALEGPYYFTADNMNFSEFTEGRFNQFFAARTVRPLQRTGNPTTQVRLPLERSFPQFSGSFHLKEVSVSGLPALQVIVEHIEPSKRKRYMPPTILFATARLEHDNGAMTLSFDESGMVERDIITLRGQFSVNESSELSGKIDYGIPAVLTHAEYKDGKSDPLFREVGQLAWVSTTLSGPASHPQDDAHMLDAAVVSERASRERNAFDDIDLERVNEYFRARGVSIPGGDAPSPGASDAEIPAEGSTPSTQPTEQQQGGDSRLDPFAPSGHALDSPF